ASTRFDELTMRFEQSDRLQTGRQSRQRSVGGHLSLSCVDAHLRPYGHGPLPVAARNEVALYLNVTQHLRQRPIVCRQERVENASVLVRQLTVPQPVAQVQLPLPAIAQLAQQFAAFWKRKE